jgi:hypothetical protein
LFNQAVYDLRTSNHPTLPLEVAVVEATTEEAAPAESVSRSVPGGPPPRASAPASAPQSNRRPPAPPRPQARPAPIPKSTAAATAPQADENTAAAGTAAPLSVDSIRAGWRDVLARVRLHDKMAEALLRDAEALKVEDDLIVLGFFYQGHVERFEKQANAKALIEKALSDSFKVKCRVRCVLSPKKAKLKAVQEDPLIQAAVNQLGAEITEIHDTATT